MGKTVGGCAKSGGGSAKSGGGSAKVGEGVRNPSIILYKMCAYFEDKK